MTTLQAGELLILEDGAYSDASFHGPFKVLKPLTFDAALLAELVALHEPRWEGQELSPNDIPAFLARLGYIEDQDHQRVYLGSYSQVDEGAFGVHPK